MCRLTQRHALWLLITGLLLVVVPLTLFVLPPIAALLLPPATSNTGSEVRFIVFIIAPVVGVAVTLMGYIALVVLPSPAKRGHCAQCGYDLRVLPGVRCPECGAHIRSDE